MKIQCGQCERKYKVPDEKVGGKAFKVRCRNCESTIIVRPDGRVSTRPPAGAGEPDVDDEAQSSHETTGQASVPASGFAGSEEQADWHVVVDGDQQGPYAPVVLSEMLTVGTIDWDAYVWREGFDGWLPARDVPELVEAITGQPYDPSYASESGDEGFAGEGSVGAAATGGFAATTGDASLDADVDSAMDNVFGGLGDSEAEESPFAPSAEHESSNLGRGLSDAPSAAGSGDFMDFGGGSSPPGAGSARPARRSSIPAGGSVPPGQSRPPAGASPAPAPFATGGAGVAGAADESAMTGQRNENSVLFSLSNLQALAGQEGAQPAPDSQAGHASGDASGLIDIRALASATGVASGGMGGTGGSPGTGSTKDDVDDLMSIGTGSALSANLAAPVLSAAEEDGDNKKWIILGGAIFAGIVVLGIILAFALGGDDDEVAMVSQPIPTNTTAATAPTTPTSAEPSAAKQPSEQEDSLEDDSLEEEDDEAQADEKDDSSGSSARRRRARRSGSSRSAASSSSTGSTAAKAPPPSDRKRDSIDDLLDEATGGGGSSKKPSGGGGSSANLPDSPSKSQVVSAMNAVGSKVRACGQGQSGVAMVSVSVSGSTGRVKSANVSGSFQGTSTGSCIARAVRSAKFPKFKQSTFTVKYPFRI